MARGVRGLRSGGSAGDAPGALLSLTCARVEGTGGLFQRLIRLTSGPAGSGLLGFPLQLRTPRRAIPQVPARGEVPIPVTSAKTITTSGQLGAAEPHPGPSL
jgi:hypothetical protein